MHRSVLSAFRVSLLLSSLGLMGSWQAASVLAQEDPRADWLNRLVQASSSDSASDAAGAVDGQIDGEFGFHTEQQLRPWWQVDLQSSCTLDRIVVFNRTTAAERAKTVTILMSDDGLAWREVYRHDGTVFLGAADQKPLVVPLQCATGRFVRLQVQEDTWMHLSEVQIYCADDPTVNVALGKPALQSSVSSWSRKRAATRPTAELVRDMDLGEQVIRQLLDPCGASGAELATRSASLVRDRVSLDDNAWIELYRDTKRLGLRWAGVQSQWQCLNVDALRLAISDLIETFGPRYAEGPRYLEQLDALAPRLAAITEGLARGDAQTLTQAEEVLALQRDALLANPLLDFGRLLCVKRAETAPAQGLPANFNGNEALARSGFDDELVVLSPLHPDGTLQTLHRPGQSFVGDVDLSYDAQRVLYSSLDKQQRWRIYELSLEDGKVRQPLQVNEPDVDNYDACYLPDGNVLFGSTSTYIGVPCVFGSSHVANLHVSDERTGDVRRLTYDQEHNWNPVVLPDGRVMYLRWEYADLAHPNSRILFAMNPDGTRQMAYYGSNSYFPNSFFYARPIPDGSSRVVGIATGHHGTCRSGRLLIVDPALGREEAQGVVQEIPGRGKKVEAVVRDRLVDGVWPQFIHPYPLGEADEPTTAGKYFLVSAKLSPTAPWGIYLVDVFDNITLVKELDGFTLFEPVPLQKRPVPPQLVQRSTAPEDPEATVYLADVYQGGGLAGVPRGEVKKLRIVSYYFSSRGMGGLLGSVGMDGPWDIRHVLGTVPVEEDGSALFKVPANTPIAVQPLDAEGKSLQHMRSWFMGVPGEVVSCVGCHERPNDATFNRPTMALNQKPASITPWYGPRRGFSFAREVQPVLDHYCTTCHDGARVAPDLRGTEIVQDWSSQIAGHVAPEYGGKFSRAYVELHGFVRRPGIESDRHMLSPLDFHADTTELVQVLRKGHYGVDLDAESWDRLVTWIDLNAPYHGTWSEIVGVPATRDTVARRRELEQKYCQVDVDWEAIGPSAALKNPNPAPSVDRMAQKTVAIQTAPTADSLLPQPQFSSLPKRTVEIAPDVAMEFVLIPAGRFTMGTNDGSAANQESAVIEIDQPFWLGTCEVTNRQYTCFDPTHDSRVESRHGYQFGRQGYPLNEPQQPVVRISWNDAQSFCEWLSARVGTRCELPTEAQWEYACRAGTSTPFAYGDFSTDFTPWANLGDRRLSEYAACTAHDNYSDVLIIPNPSRYDDWVPKDARFDDGAFAAATVGRYQANAWGLHDMHGNVWEWTRSAEAPAPYRDDDGRNALTGSERRIVRGGSWYDRPQRATSDYRLSFRPYHRVFTVGLRVMMAADPTAIPVAVK
jgi:formylglycine-generating enzyme required for sulfatase activity